MKIQLKLLLAPILGALLCSCASTSVKETWKAPDYTNLPVKKTALIAVLEEGTMARHAFEGQIVAALGRRKAAAFVTHDMGRLAEIKADLPAMAEKLKAKGADSVFVVRFVDKETHSRDVRESSERYVPVVTGYAPAYSSPYYSYYGYYEMAFMSMTVVRGQLSQTYLLDYALYDLETKKLIWTGRTRSAIKYDADRLGELYSLTEKIASGMQRDGVIR